jgi:hypothetical protein
MAIRAIALLPLIVVGACHTGVPPVDDPYNIVINGEKLTQAVFLQKYCIDQAWKSTCLKVSHAARTNIRGRVPRL